MDSIAHEDSASIECIDGGAYSLNGESSCI